MRRSRSTPTAELQSTPAGRGGETSLWLATIFFFFSLSACWLWKTHICGRESQLVGQFCLPSSLQPATSPSQLKRTEEGGFF